jgi:copper chaperone CopZ
MATPTTTELHVSGMTCNNCARKVTDAAQKIPGVHSVAVSVATERASVRWNAAGEQDVSALLAAISKAGFEAKEMPAIIDAGNGRSSSASPSPACSWLVNGFSGWR